MELTSDPQIVRLMREVHSHLFVALAVARRVHDIANERIKRDEEFGYDYHGERVIEEIQSALSYIERVYELEG